MVRGAKRSQRDLLQIHDGIIVNLTLQNTGNGDKFYEISVEKNRVISRYGKIGSKGTSVFKEFDDDDEMRKYIEKLVTEKKRKGYEEAKSNSSPPAPAPVVTAAAAPSTSVTQSIPSSPEKSDSDSILSGEELKSTLHDLKKAIAESKGFWICDSCTFQNEDNKSYVCEMCQTRRIIPPVAPPGQWACAHCTFLNMDSDTRCVQCFIPTKPSIKPEPKSDEDENTWKCPACTFWNELKERQCLICDAPNPDNHPSDSEEDEKGENSCLDDDYSDEDPKPKKKSRKVTSASNRASTRNVKTNSGGSNHIYMEYTQGSSNKFYELKLCPKPNGYNVSVRYGRIGSSGVEAIKHFSTQQEALSFLNKTADSKRKKGYVDQSGSSGTNNGGDDDDEDDIEPPTVSRSSVGTSLNVSSNQSNILTTSITNHNNSLPSSSVSAPSSAANTPLQEIFLTCKEGGSNKFYELKQYHDRVKVRYGRCGTGGTVLEKNFATSMEALAFYNKTRIEKINKGYKISVKSNDDDEPPSDPSQINGSGDPLADLEAGKKVFVKGSSSMPYTLKKFNGGYSCTCPGFVIQIRIKGIQATTCKHLKEIRGEDAEMLRCNLSAGVVANPSSKQNKNPSINGMISLAHKWAPSKDPTGWIMSEKLDGMRAYWNGKKLWSRNGLPVIAPDWFIAGLPSDMHLDGELFLGRGLFDDCMSIARRTDASDDWKKLRYVIFDAPQVKAGILARLEKAKEVISSAGNPYAIVHPHDVCQSMDHLLDKLAEIEQVGGEGVMLRHPTAPHRGGRTNDLLKVKSFHDDEAIIIGYEPGKGKYQGMVGSLVCMLKSGEVFKVGSGLTDHLRSYSRIPAIGTVITFQYFELTKDGVPRFPTYLRVRPDVDPSIFPKSPISANAVQMPS